MAKQLRSEEADEWGKSRLGICIVSSSFPSIIRADCKYLCFTDEKII